MLRLATFNVMHGRSLADGRVARDRFRAAVGDLDADVVGLQEVDLGQPRSGGLDLAELAAGAVGARPSDWHFEATVYGTPGESWRPADGGRGADEPAYGIALVSRLPVRTWKIVRLGRAPVRSPVAVPTAAGRPRLIVLDDEPRAAVVAVVEPDGPSSAMTVVTTHLSFVPGWNAVQLRRLLRELDGLPEPVVLLGDLNLPGWTAKLATGWRQLAAVPTYPATRPRVQLDHVLVHDRLAQPLVVRSVEARQTVISDHRALVVELV